MGAFRTIHAHPGLQEFWDTAVSRLTDPIDPAFVRDFQVSTLARGVPPEFLNTVVSESLQVPARVVACRLQGISGNARLFAWARAICRAGAHRLGRPRYLRASRRSGSSVRGDCGFTASHLCRRWARASLGRTGPLRRGPCLRSSTSVDSTFPPLAAPVASFVASTLREKFPSTIGTDPSRRGLRLARQCRPVGIVPTFPHAVRSPEGSVWLRIAHKPRKTVRSSVRRPLRLVALALRNVGTES